MIRVKPEYAHQIIGFNNSMKPLGERDDLHILLIDAKAHNVKHILDLFEEVPTDDELMKSKEDAFNEKQSRKATKESE